MQVRYTLKSVITLLLGVLLAQGLVAQHSLMVSNLVNGAGVPSPGQAFGGGPVNDDCSGAVVVALAAGTPEVRTGDNTGATDSYGYGNEVWEAFTLTECADVLVEFCGTTPVFTGAQLPPLFVNCPLTNWAWLVNQDVVICGDGNFSFNYAQLSPGTYYFPVYQTAGSTGAYQVTFTATACSGTPPVNDDCSGAVVLTAAPACAPVNGDVLNAAVSGGSIPGDGCSFGNPSDDVWYSFVATAVDHSIIVDPSDSVSVVIELHLNDCSGTNLIICHEGDNWGTVEQMDATGLTVGSTYYVRIYDWYAGAPNTTAFTICLLGPAVCTADAGTLTADDDEMCLTGNDLITAQPNGDAVVPTGYSQFYLLSTEPGGVITQLGTEPEFTVTELGVYTIHSLVVDTLTFDPAGMIELGTGTITEIDTALIQGGGDICGGLDTAGATTEVIECLPCSAVAGSLTADETEVCLVAGSAIVSATPDGNSNIPLGFITAYMLAQAPGSVVVNEALTPDFNVTAAGDYTIHTLVYDPNTFDLSSVLIGVTTIAEIDTALEQGGGDICASLDLTGAPTTVSECVTCDANAGTLTADASPVCLLAGTADISATADGNMVVPAGFDTLYVLTQDAGLIIGMDTTSAFTVTAEGSYTIHTLVYDPLTLDTSLVDIGVTTLAGVDTLLIQGGGTICGSLDTTGAPIEVNDCAPVNDDCVGAVMLPINAVGSCPGAAVAGDNTYATHDGADPGCDPSTDGYADVWYSFNSGDNTTVTIDLGPGTMVDWGIEVLEGCNGNDVFCEAQPLASIELTTTPNTTYVIRVYSNLQFGAGGAFTICLTGLQTAVACDGGTVETVLGSVSETVCQDASADVIDFATTSISAENYAFVLTDTDNIIIALLVGNSLDFNSAPVGDYRVWGVSYNGDLEGAIPGASIDTIGSSGACVDTSSNFVEVTVEICSGITENNSAGWNIFPNPGNGDFTLSYSGADANTMIEVIDMRGRMVYQERATMVRGQRHTLHLGGQLAEGIYSVRLTNAAGSSALRLTIR